MFMGLDTSMSTARPGKMGWARGESRAIPASDVLEFPPVIDGDWGPILGIVDEFFHSEIAAPGVTKVGYESSFFSAGSSDITHYTNCQRLVGMLQWLCWKRRIEFVPVAIASWRRDMLGVGKAPKELERRQDRTNWWKESVLAECKRRGWIPPDAEGKEAYDRADGCGVWNHLASQADDTHDSGNLPLFAA